MLGVEERNALLLEISKQQRQFIEGHVKRGYKTGFTRFMLSDKASVIKMTDNVTLEDIEQQVADWEIVDYRDYGLGNRLGKCACGRSLRYEFIVEHTLTKKQIHYGKFHLADFFNISASDIQGVIDGLQVVDYEADELLMKIKEGNYGYEIIDKIPKGINIPLDIKNHMDNNIPLLNSQLYRILQVLEDNFEKEKYKQFQKVQDELKYEAKLEVIESVNAQFFHMNKSEEFVNIGEVAYHLVVSGISSAVAISHIIHDFYKVKKGYSQSSIKRPLIYHEVLSALRDYSEKGMIYFDRESSGVENSYFFPKSQ
ncbi:hypothetical protein ABD87_22620 [Lysinibacillus sphaericus]|uniref:hypothetical protein n=1 Tax=Lysinibacillus sphaericus TaxID=1421 RepID=UPI0018CD1516|nr:hypothetical protein [Lysinibacillus sphaericus]MBG9732221.1 hypothetical protein [Lysinibacillus sphaericus]